MMKGIKKSISIFWSSVDWKALKTSSKEVGYLTLLALLPLIINILIHAIPEKGFVNAAKEKIIPGEILSYCMSFLAPSLYLLTKTQGSGYKLPLVHFFSLTTIVVYTSAVVIYLIAKNKLLKEIDMENHGFDLYFSLALVFLFTSILFRVYSVYHGKNASNWVDNRTRQQKDFNERFSESLK